eukprot:COSAG02_NODE_31076_length_539_cov_1.895455_1_plen_62_part_10
MIDGEDEDAGDEEDATDEPGHSQDRNRTSPDAVLVPARTGLPCAAPPRPLQTQVRKQLVLDD